MSPEIESFYKQLETHRKPESDDPYDNRITHCYLKTTHKEKEHIFEVRGFHVKDGVLIISVVNWTLCAGTAQIEMDDEIVGKYSISETWE